jgi:hypothetical protein
LEQPNRKILVHQLLKRNQLSMMMVHAPIHPKHVWIVQVLAYKTTTLMAHVIAWK